MMEFKNITISNFLSYYGENSIDFSDMTTIFIGQNNTGKSKLFDAINFAIYRRIFPTHMGLNGEWVDEIREIAPLVLNRRRRKEALENGEEKVVSGVALTVSLDDSILNIERTITFKNTGNDLVYDNNDFTVVQMAKYDGSVIRSSLGADAADQLELFFSRSIKDYFLFQGEAASKIMQLHKGGNFAKAVNEIARLSVFEQAKDIANDYTRHVNNLINRKLNKNKELQEKQLRLEKDISDCEAKMKKYAQQRDDAQKDEEKYVVQLEKLEEQLSQMKEFEEWLKKKNEYEKNIKRIQQEIKSAESEKTVIAEDAVFYKIREKIGSFKNFYAALEKKGEVPPSIPAAEIKKALDYKRCTICNTDLSEGTSARNFALARLPKCDTDRLGNYLRELNHTFGDSTEDVQKIPQKLQEILEYKRKLEDRKKRLVAEKEEIEEFLNAISVGEDQSQQKKKEIEELKNSVSRYRSFLEKARADYNRNSALYDDAEAHFKSLCNQQGSDIGAAPEITKQDKIWSNCAKDIAAVMNKLFTVAYDTAYGKIQAKADEFYKEMTKDNSGLVGSIKIDTASSEIYTVDEKGEHIYNINQGNRISIQLAVIAGILTVAQQEFGQQYPFVTDAPVSALGGDNKRSTIQTMIDAFEQSIIIVKDDASSLNKDSDEIRNLILNNKSVGAVYELSMSEATTKDEQYTIVKKIKG